MSHKVHPKAYRLRESSDWDSRWLNKKRLPEYLEEDFRIREYLGKVLKEGGVEKVEIERFSGKVIAALRNEFGGHEVVKNKK